MFYFLLVFCSLFCLSVVRQYCSLENCKDSAGYICDGRMREHIFALLVSSHFLRLHSTKICYVNFLTQIDAAASFLSPLWWRATSLYDEKCDLARIFAIILDLFDLSKMRFHLLCMKFNGSWFTARAHTKNWIAAKWPINKQLQMPWIIEIILSLSELCAILMEMYWCIWLFGDLVVFHAFASLQLINSLISFSAKQFWRSLICIFTALFAAHFASRQGSHSCSNPFWMECVRHISSYNFSFYFLNLIYVLHSSMPTLAVNMAAVCSHSQNVFYTLVFYSFCSEQLWMFA